MGAQASASRNTIENDFITKAYNKCPNVSANNEINLSGVQFRPDMNPMCKNPKFEINQSAGVEADCVVKNIQDTLAETVSKMSTQSQGGLGFQASASSSDIKTQIEQMVENDCGNQSASNKADISDTLVTACDWHFVQNATAKSSCAIDSLQQMSNKVSSQQDTAATGLTLASFLTGYGGIMTAVVAIILISGLGYGTYTYYNENKESQQGGCGDKRFNIIIILFLILCFSMMTNKKNNY